VHVLCGDAEDALLLAGDTGYGFITRLKNLHGRQKAGKAVLNLTAGSAIVPPVDVEAEADRVAVATSAGRLLVFPLAQLPELARGKGNKLIDIPAARRKDGSEKVAGLCVLTPDQPLMVLAGKRTLTLKGPDLAGYEGERGRRGRALPRGFQRVDGLAPSVKE